MERTRPYYSKKQIRDLISENKIILESSARESARDTLGWLLSDIKKALLDLPQECCYKSEQRFNNPACWVDYYRANNIMGENIYTHFYVDNDCLIVDSFKKR